MIQSKKSVKDLVCKTYALEQQIQTMTEEYKNNKKILQELFDEKDIDRLGDIAYQNSEHDDALTLEIIRKERVLVNFLVDKIKEKMPREILPEIINKTYVVNDMESLKLILKKSGISPKAFKSLFTVQEQINKEAIKQLYSVGDISREQLKGCFTTNIQKSLKIQRQKKEGGKD